MPIRKPTKKERDLEGKAGDEQLKRAKHDGVSTEQILAEDQVVQKLGLPVTWETGDQPVRIRGARDARIVDPNDSEIASYAVTPRRTICGECKHHDLEKGREEIIRQGFAQRLVVDEEWALRHLGAPLDTFGLCAMDPTMVCSVMGLACDQFKTRK